MDEANVFVRRLVESHEARKVDGLVLEAALVCLMASQDIFYEDNAPLV